MKKKRISVVTVLVLLSNVITASGLKGDMHGNNGNLFHNRFYARYSHGLSIYLTDVKNGTEALSGKEIRAGMTFEPEIGVYIKDQAQIGISYLYMDGVAEDTSLFGLWYDDVFFSGAAIKARYFLLNRQKIKVPVGVEGIFGECLMYSGITDDLASNRPLGDGWGKQYSAYRYFRANGFGGGITGAFLYQPFSFFSFGIDAMFRVIMSDNLERTDGVVKSLADFILLPLLNGTDSTENRKRSLNFSSLNLSAYISFQY